MRLDDVLPRWQFGEHHDIAFSGSVAAVERVTWREVPLFRALLFAGSLGRTRMPADRPFLTQLTAGGFTVLSRSADALVVGAVVRVGDQTGPVPLGDDPAATFRAVDEPGHYKVAFDFRVQDGVLRTETRVLATDEDTRRRFRRYWRLIRIPSGLIRTEWLRAARRRSA
ncbi:hypothetical protein [Actinokineospora fastidiosa]|uniref:DUF2867 domain-containing protein n=1 Tax=Actinokineospora fastidiosa TaxID=1816 RepID=A0A918LEH3_9PSEU|nr:hypothetical protein [Actinokineospora fastidiosa]GGS36308.1 hypothetical protein GCM10010171_33680 [Actinokineospora fastidiosa]